MNDMVFYDKFTNVLGSSILCLASLLVSIEFLTFYFVNQLSVFYYLWISSMVIAVFYGAKSIRDYQSFKMNIHLFVEQDSPIKPLEIEGLEELPLKVCLYYHNGATLEQMRQDLGLDHSQEVKRELVKGLGILLRSYNESHVEKVEV